MTTVLVTGPIGGGKSTVCRYLEASGYPVYDCDSRCKSLYETVPGLKARIESELGLPFGQLGQVFGSSDKLSKLESLVYPLLLEDLKLWKDAQKGRDLVFVESAVALDKPLFRGQWDKVLLVDAPRELRLSRNAHAAQRDSLQFFEEKPIDYKIFNDSDLKSLYNKVDKYLERL